MRNIISLLIIIISTYCHSQSQGYTTIPDENFETALRALGLDDSIINDGVVPTDKINSITYLDVHSKKITDLTGIEDFEMLKELNCSRNKLISIDVSKNTKLTDLNCGTNKLKSINLSKNINLVRLGIRRNKITNIDISKNIRLTILDIDSNQLTSLDTSNNTELLALICTNNRLTSLDISNKVDFKVLYCFSNTDLYCIKVDNITEAKSYKNWTKDSQATYSLDCILSVEITDDITGDITITSSEEVTLNIVFSEEITGLELSDFDLTLVNATVENLHTVDNINFTIKLKPIADGDVIVELSKNMVLSAIQLGNSKSNTYSFIYDNTPPVADLGTLPDINKECIIDLIEPPTATDNNDSRTITGTTDTNFPITKSTTIIWEYKDSLGNSSSQTQTVIIEDITPPYVDEISLQTIVKSDAIDSIKSPTTNDNCDTGIITAVTST